MRKSVVAAAMIAALTTGCGGGTGSEEAVDLPPGRRVVCDLTTLDGPVRLSLELPEDFERIEPEESDCGWLARIEVRGDADGDGEGDEGMGRYTAEVVVTVGSVSADATLQDVYDDLEGDLSPDGTPQNDDSILRLELTEDVPVFGDVSGDRLAVLCYCDGQNTISRRAQAAGVRLTWSSVSTLTDETDAALDRALTGAELVPRS